MEALKEGAKYLFGYFLIMVIASPIKGVVAGAVGALVGKALVGLTAAMGPGAPPGQMTANMAELAAQPPGIITRAAATLALMALILIPALGLAIKWMMAILEGQDMNRVLKAGLALVLFAGRICSCSLGGPSLSHANFRCACRCSPRASHGRFV